jgi:hypothetical protein
VTTKWCAPGPDGSAETVPSPGVKAVTLTVLTELNSMASAARLRSHRNSVVVGRVRGPGRPARSVPEAPPGSQPRRPL